VVDFGRPARSLDEDGAARDGSGEELISSSFAGMEPFGGMAILTMPRRQSKAGKEIRLQLFRPLRVSAIHRDHDLGSG